MSAADLDRLLAGINALPPLDRLRLAAELLGGGKPRLARAIAESVVLELGAAMALDALGGKP